SATRWWTTRTWTDGHRALDVRLATLARGFQRAALFLVPAIEDRLQRLRALCRCGDGDLREQPPEGEVAPRAARGRLQARLQPSGVGGEHPAVLLQALEQRGDGRRAVHHRGD